MTEQTRREVEALLEALAELAREAVVASADGRLSVDELAALSVDVVRLGRAIAALCRRRR